MSQTKCAICQDNFPEEKASYVGAYDYYGKKGFFFLCPKQKCIKSFIDPKATEPLYLYEEGVRLER